MQYYKGGCNIPVSPFRPPTRLAIFQARSFLSTQLDTCQQNGSFTRTTRLQKGIAGKTVVLLAERAKLDRHAGKGAVLQAENFLLTGVAGKRPALQEEEAESGCRAGKGAVLPAENFLLEGVAGKSSILPARQALLKQKGEIPGRRHVICAYDGGSSSLIANQFK